MRTGEESTWRVTWRKPFVRRLTLLGALLLIVAGSMLLKSGTIAFWQVASGTGSLAMTIVDNTTGVSTPVRIRLTNAQGEPVVPPDNALAVMWGRFDAAEDFASLPNGDFYTEGAFELTLPAGIYQLRISKGYEYLEQEHEVVIAADEEVLETYRMVRWVDMPSRGWVSADDHIHLRRSPRDNQAILGWIAAEDLQVGTLLQMGDFWATYYSQYAWGLDGVYHVEDRLLASGQEDPRTHERGHTISLAADDFVRLEDPALSQGPSGYYYYDQVFDRIHELGGMTGYAHQAVTFHGYRGLTLDVLRDKVDFLELLQFCAADGPLHTDHYYHFLNLGFELTATAGSDFPWCGRSPNSADPRIGDARFYTYVGDEFTFETWRESVRDGHTFVTSGPIIELTVNEAIPGDRVDVESGSALRITARAQGHATQIPLEELEIVAHGVVIESVSARDPNQSSERLAVTMSLPVDHGVWIAARTRAGPTQIAHSTPVYVTVSGSGFHSPDTLEEYLDLSGQYLDELQEEIAQPNDSLDHLAWRDRAGLEEQIAETREVITKLRWELGDGE